MIKKIDKNQERQRRHERVRKTVNGTTARPRLCIYRSVSNIYVQIIDDTKGVTLVSASSLEKDLKAKVAGKSKIEQAEIVGQEIAKRAIAKGIKTVVCDRGGYLYTGRVKKLTDSARAAGLEF
ncbi:MAG: 50S ribosomal protein L18 [Clostridia bacterium]|nr:50S ribosomal protein L18 [Clostridia bacterium]